jgi:dephospho-CoA kinase
MPLTIGLTGGIGAGKSTAARLLTEFGAEVVSGDELGRVVVDSSPRILAAIRQRFGDEVFDQDGRLVRRDLGRRAFADRRHAHWLTEITRDPILELWRERVRFSRAAVIVFDAALIFEWGVEGEFDLLVVVFAPAHDVAVRMAENGRFTPEEAAHRLTAQLDPGHKARVANVTIRNDDSLEALNSRVADFWSNVVVPELNRTSPPV